MLILGWDIGIKNLSYCLVEYNGNWENDKANGYGELISNNGDTYKG